MPVEVEDEVPVPPPAPVATIPTRLRPSSSDESSWTCLMRLVRQEDEDKVQMCQEKVNMCLLFSGLFSIVLSVFLVDSLRNLQPNYGAMTVELLGQISAQTQSFLLSPQYANATIILPSLTVNAASPTAIHVTTLWTASLIVSIIAASLGFLFKQWLFEYITRNSLSPEADLRTRHSQRSEWGLFELVVFLPLLSQISMALFFAGLCIQTVHANPTAGYTAVSLVAGWACGLALLIVAPVLSPQCPYKLPFTESLTGSIRYFIRQSLSSPWRVSPTMKVYHAWESIVMEQVNAAKCDEVDIDLLVSLYSRRREDHVLNIMWDALKESGATPENLLRYAKKIVVVAYPTSRWDTESHKKNAVVPVAAMRLRSLPKSAYSTIIENIGGLLQEEIYLQTGGNDTKAVEWSSWMKEALCFILGDSPHSIPPGTSALLAKLMNEDRVDAFFDVIVSSLAGDETYSQVSADDLVYILSRIQEPFKVLKTMECLPCLLALLRRCLCNDQHGTLTRHRSFLSALKGHVSSIPPACLHAMALLLFKRLSDDIFPTMYWFAYLSDIIDVLLYIHHTLPPGQAEYDDLHAQLVKLTRRLLLQSRNTAIYLRLASGQSQNNEDQVTSASRLFLDAFVSSTAADRFLILDNIRAAFDWQLVQRPEEEDNTWDRYVRLHVTKTYLLVLKAVEELKDLQSAEPLKGVLSMINELVARKLRGTLTIATLPDSDSSVPGDSVEKTDVDGTEDELKAKTGDDAKGAGTDEVNVVKPVDAEEKQEGATDVSAAQDVQDDKPEDAKTVPKVPCQQDIDVAKHCLSLVTSLEPVPVSQGTSDDEFAAWAKSFDAGSSFFSDDIIQALHEVLPRDDSVALARLRRIEWLKAEKAESAEVSASSGVNVAEVAEETKSAE